MCLSCCSLVAAVSQQCSLQHVRTVRSNPLTRDKQLGRRCQYPAPPPHTALSVPILIVLKRWFALDSQSLSCSAGKKVEYNVMAPGSRYSGLRTFTTHPWVLEDPEGTVYAVYVGTPPASRDAWASFVRLAAWMMHRLFRDQRR